MPKTPGRIIVLNGTPRSGKSSIVGEIQGRFEGIWINLGVDQSMGGTSHRYRPGIGLRPGGERPYLEPVVASLFRALYGSILAHADQGINVVVDVGHHEAYSKPLGILVEVSGVLAAREAWLIGVRCPVEENMRRREMTGMIAPREMVERWEKAVHSPGIYDLEVDTSVFSPEECAEAILRRVDLPPTAFRRLARPSSAE